MLTKAKKIITKMIYTAVCICLIVPFITIYGQSISTLENKLQELNKNYSRELALLDSLKLVLDNRAKQIDAEKKKPDYDESSVKKLMSASITLSNKIDEQQKMVNATENGIEKARYELDKKYTAVIDSLSELEKSGKYEGDKNELKALILRLTEKKILTAPKVYSLSFNPKKILSLDPESTKTPEEKKIYYEYLSEALEEVNSRLKQMKSMNEEVDGIISLQKKTKKFLEEVEFSSTINRTSLTSRGQENSKTTSLTTGDIDFANETRNIVPQIQTYIYILKQLDFKTSSNLKTTDRFSFDAAKKNISLQEYSELLAEVEKRLTEYQTVLVNKIGSRK